MSVPPSGSATTPVPLAYDEEGDTAVVASTETSDRTEPQVAPPQPPLAESPVRSPAPSVPPRATKKTLVSPIPALLAAQMTKVIEGEAVDDATPSPMDVRGDATARLAEWEQDEILRDDDEADYVVELVGPVKASG